MNSKKRIMTTTGGNPISDKQNSVTAGPRGPLLLQDYQLIEKLAHQNRERIPERPVHAKGSGAYGTFRVTHDITKYTKAALFSAIGKETPVFFRSADCQGYRSIPVIEYLVFWSTIIMNCKQTLARRTQS